MTRTTRNPHLVLDVWGAAPDVHRRELEPASVHGGIGLLVLCDDDDEGELRSVGHEGGAALELTPMVERGF